MIFQAAPLYLLASAIAMVVTVGPLGLLPMLPTHPSAWMLVAFIVAWLMLALLARPILVGCWQRARELSR
ncbi:hypothetical protein [Pseudoxanthomonas sp. PXM02]|uniref:hypothetical protein n=1 Tax=Pseudoxanthomonas sp. PXM02 TaxID=2769294 RepID=UPI0017852E29|nr:hypothetical protein [Pseudoxanthomonas sp. PXM02]MBD9478626.1 hypothetical protein [Pseudoxanthomonas sp. PXM02]